MGNLYFVNFCIYIITIITNWPAVKGINLSLSKFTVIRRYKHSLALV